MSRLPIARFIAAAALSLAACLSSPALAYNGLVIFGDSLSDSGNNASQGLYQADQSAEFAAFGNQWIPTFAYAPAKTYSNGPIWASSFGRSTSTSRPCHFRTRPFTKTASI